LGTWWPELRQAARRLARRPALSAVASATLAVGLGGATAIFAVADAVLFRPLPYPDTDRLVLLWQSDLERNQPFVELPYAGYRDWRDQNPVFVDLAGMASVGQTWTLCGRGEPAGVTGRIVTGNFFSVLGVEAAIGRTLRPEDDRVGAAPVVVVSHRLWRDRLSPERGVLGQSLVLDGESHTIVGVMPEGFAFPSDAQLWTPLLPAVGAEIAENPGLWWMTALGRLEPGLPLDQARARMTGLVSRYNRERFQALNMVAVLTPLPEAVFGPMRPALLALLAAVGLVLVAACSNVAGLLLVRTSEGGRELAVRAVLGASPIRLAGSLMADSLLLTCAGGLVGLLAAGLGIPLLAGLAPRDVPRLENATVDLRVFGFALCVSAATALLAGLAPMLLLRRAALETTLREGAIRLTAARGRLGSGLVMGQLALAVVLLAGAGLLGRSLLELRRVPLGFEPERLLSVEGGASEARYPEPAQWRAFHQEALRRVRALPGVESAAAVTLRPLWNTVGLDWPVVVEGQSEAEASRNPMVNLEAVSADFFRTMGVPLVRGRGFGDADVEGRPGVVVVSESLARRYWPGRDSIGQRLRIPLPGTPYDGTWMTVVGVAGETRYRELRASRMDLYVSYLQGNLRPGHLMVRARGEPAALAPAVREAVWGLDRQQVPPDVIPMASVVSRALGEPRFATRVITALALVELLLAAIGLYGLLAYSIAGRTREIGLRRALGAAPRDIVRAVMGEGMRLVVTGLAAGLLIALGATRWLGSLLYGVRPTDPLTFAAAAVVLLLVAALACGLPLRRALRVDPAVALRHD
jgi:putative ABC transport system permease protein